MKFYINRKILIGFVVSILIIFSLGLSSFLYIRNLIEVSRWGAHARQVLYQTEQVRSFAMEFQAAQFRFALTGNEDALKPYTAAVTSVKGAMDELDLLIADNPAQQARMARLRDFMEKRIKFSDEVIAARKKSFEDANALVMTLRGAKIMDDAQHIINEVQQEENTLIKERSSSVGKQFYQFAYAFIGLLISMFVTLVILTWSVNANMKARTAAENKLKRTSIIAQDLYENAPCGYFSIDKDGVFNNINKTMLDWLGHSKDEVVGKLSVIEVLKMEGPAFFKEGVGDYRKKGFLNNVEAEMVLKDNTLVPAIMNVVAMNDDHGNLVGSRCTVFDNTERKKAEEDVKASNRELEAFSYSVSHDLRAPLRSVDGYAQILKEDYSAGIDDEGKRVINVIINNAKRMGQLIDDLLDFSRAGRREITKSKINMNDFVKVILEELVEREGERKIKIDLRDLTPSTADVNTLRQVWVNLLSNALKYTLKKEDPFVEIGCRDEPKEVVYYVRDNGAGFNMQYYDKLFGVFQRLHKAQDFEGTGVGLAFVKRIIERHHGKVWAEGQLNEGATFYFSIPKL